jgi:light-harvesting complex I chlorophyll a/b binding protein 1
MMRCATLIILHASVACANTNEDPVDMTVDNLIGELVEWVPAPPAQTADLDDMTLGNVPSTVNIAKDKLMAYGINPGPLGMLALTAIDANNRGTGMRNVAAMAMKMPDNTKSALSHLSKQVVVKAEAIEEMAGITKPWGFWDPAKFSTNCDGKSLAFYREAELKHGRVAMLATLGIIVGEKFSPILGAAPAPAVLQFGKATAAGPATFWGAVIVAVSFLELSLMNGQQWSTERNYNNPLEAGDFGWDPMGMKPKKPEELKTLQNKELLNGRLAMISAAGIIAQEMVTGKKIF